MAEKLAILWKLGVKLKFQAPIVCLVRKICIFSEKCNLLSPNFLTHDASAV